MLIAFASLRDGNWEVYVMNADGTDQTRLTFSPGEDSQPTWAPAPLIDTDDDGDGVADGADAFPLDANESVDTDGDGTGNNADTDDDGDGTPDATDRFPLDASEWADADNDGTGDNADDDDDNDGFFDIVDGCPLVPGPANGCSPTEAVTNLETEITELNLAGNTEQVLTNTLSNVNRAIDNGQTAAAEAQLGAFVRQVEALQRRGVLSEEAAAALIAGANGIASGL